MNKKRFVAGGIAVVAGTLPLLVVSPALAAYEYVSPADDGQGNDAVWYTGETQDIEWSVDAETGAYTLELWSTGGAAAKIATIGTGDDITDGLFTWTIPTSITALVADDVSIKLDPETGTTIESDAFDLRKSGAADAEFLDGNDDPMTEVVAGEEYEATWTSAGETGGKVAIDLVRTVSGKSKVTNLVKSTADDGSADVTIPAKQAADTSGGAATYKLRVTPLNAAAASDSSDAAFKVLAPVLTVTSQATAANSALGDAVEITWTNTGPNANANVSVKGASGKAVVVATNVTSPYDWYPTATGVYDVIVSDTKAKKLIDTSTAKVTVTASTEIVTQEAPSDITVTNGQQIELSWGFYDDDQDATANGTALPVDITLVDSANKVIKVAEKVLGEEDTLLRSYTWGPGAKVKPGAYTVKIARSGSTTTSNQSITIAAPTALTVANSSTSVEPGAKIDIEWSITDSAVLPVSIDLVPATGKPVNLAKKLLDADGEKTVRIPATTAAGSYTVKVTTADKFGSTPATLSDDVAVTVVAATLTVTATSSVTNGGDLVIAWEYGDDSQSPVKLELFKGSATKPAAVISKSAPTADPGEGTYTWKVGGKLAAGTDYKVKATVVGPKTSPATDDSGAVAIAAPVITVDDLAAPVTVGQTVELTWGTAATEDLGVTISIVKGTKVVAKLDSKELTVNGDGSYSWLVGSKLVAGADYKVRVTSNDIATVTDDSAVFTVQANSTSTT